MLKIVLLVTGVAALLLSFIPSLRTEATPFLQHPDAIYLAILGLINLLFAPVLQSSHPTRPLQAGAAALLVLGVVLQALILLAPLPTIADQPAIVLPLLSLVLATALQLAGSLKPGKPVSRSASAPTALGGSQDSGNRETGTVKWFNTSKGFGFISRDSGEDIFVHFRAIRGEGHRILIEGQRVEFSVVQRDKGLQAEDVIASSPLLNAQKTRRSAGFLFFAAVSGGRRFVFPRLAHQPLDVFQTLDQCRDLKLQSLNAALLLDHHIVESLQSVILESLAAFQVIHARVQLHLGLPGKTEAVGQHHPQLAADRLDLLGRIRLSRMAPPDRAGPGVVATSPDDHVHVELADHIAQVSDIHLVRTEGVLEHLCQQRGLAPQRLLVIDIELEQLGDILPPRHQDEPRIAGIVHQQQAAEGKVAEQQGVLLQPGIQSEHTDLSCSTVIHGQLSPSFREGTRRNCRAGYFAARPKQARTSARPSLARHSSRTPHKMPVE